MTKILHEEIKNCGNCPCRVFGEGIVYCNYTDTEIKNDKKINTDCPLPNKGAK